MDAPINTNPLAAGSTTSEGQYTLVAVIAGTVLEAVGSILTALEHTHPNASWMALALVAVGALLQAATLFGYNKGRALLKSNAILAGLQSGLPIVAEAIAASIEAAGKVKPEQMPRVMSATILPK